MALMVQSDGYTSYIFVLCDLSHPDNIVRSYILFISVVDPVGSASFWRIRIQIRISICGLHCYLYF
jgi:hypothetical protein